MQLVKRRAFSGGADLAKLQRFTSLQIREHGRCGLMHPGDIPHRIYNALRRDDPHQLVHLWEDGTGAIAGWVLLDPRGAGLDPQISPGIRDDAPGLELEINTWAEDELSKLMRARGSTATSIETDAFEDDMARVKTIEGLGWIAQDEEIVMLSRRSLSDLPEPELPPGYKIRTVRGVAEAGPVSELHAAGFGSSWTPELYRRVMESPGYDPAREFLVEAPDGQLAAFCVAWPDELNKTGLFEPVAVHPDHRRRHLGSAIMRAAMAAMVGWGMEWAEVMWETDNPGSGALYRSEGFEPIFKTVFYRKPISL